MSTTLSAVERKAKQRKITWIKVFPRAPILCCFARWLIGVAIDFAQEKVLGQGPQDNESAIEQAKDEQISDCEPPPPLSGDVVMSEVALTEAESHSGTV